LVLTKSWGSGVNPEPPLFKNPAMAPNDPPQLQHGPVVSTTEARSGVTGHNVRYVLIYGLIATIAAFAIILYVVVR
jgi:hypothetical protein